RGALPWGSVTGVRTRSEALPLRGGTAKMNRMTIGLLSLLAGMTLASAPLADGQSGHEPTLQEKLVGTWRLVSAKYGGQDATFPAGTVTLKHVTPAQFMWASYGADGTLTRAAGGSYTLKGDVYEETPQYGMSGDFEIIRGKVQSFKCRIDGNRWYH